MCKPVLLIRSKCLLEYSKLLVRAFSTEQARFFRANALIVKSLDACTAGYAFPFKTCRNTSSFQQQDKHRILL